MAKVPRIRVESAHAITPRATLIISMIFIAGLLEKIPVALGRGDWENRLQTGRGGWEGRLQTIQKRSLRGGRERLMSLLLFHSFILLHSQHINATSKSLERQESGQATLLLHDQ